MALDLLLQGAARPLVDEVAQTWRSLDILVTNAGAAQGGFLELEDDARGGWIWPQMFANLRVIKRAWLLLKTSSGHLVIIGGGTARTPERQLALVSAVNGGLAALSKSIAEQGTIDGIRVKLVQPCMVRTSRRQKLFEKWSSKKGMPVDELRRAHGPLTSGSSPGHPMSRR